MHQVPFSSFALVGLGDSLAEGGKLSIDAILSPASKHSVGSLQHRIAMSADHF